MTDYPLDITISCAYGLGGGIARYGTGDMPKSTTKFIKEWLHALGAVLRTPKYNKYLSMQSRTMAKFDAPIFTSHAIDYISVPYRSFYYAYRIAAAYKKINNALQGNQSGTFVDFGHGFSPLAHLVKMNNENSVPVLIDNPLTQEIFATVSNSVGYSADNMLKSMHQINDIKKSKKCIFSSLGTFVYISHSHQQELLHKTSMDFKHFFIEIESISEPQRDAKLVQNFGAPYTRGWNLDDIYETVGNVDIIKMSELATSNLDILAKHARIKKSLSYATEMFISK